MFKHDSVVRQQTNTKSGMLRYWGSRCGDFVGYL